MAKGEKPAGYGTGAMEGSLGEYYNENVKSKDRVHVCLNGTPLGNVKIQYAQLPYVTNFKYLGTPWRYEYRSEREDTVWMENLEEDVRGPMRQEDIRKMIIYRPTVRGGYSVDG